MVKDPGAGRSPCAYGTPGRFSMPLGISCAIRIRRRVAFARSTKARLMWSTPPKACKSIRQERSSMPRSWRSSWVILRDRLVAGGGGAPERLAHEVRLGQARRGPPSPAADRR